MGCPGRHYAWWHFCQQVRADSGSHRAPDYPHVGYLLTQIGFKIMRSKSCEANPADDFVRRVHQSRYAQMKTLLLAAFADGVSERLAKNEGAKTLIGVQGFSSRLWPRVWLVRPSGVLQSIALVPLVVN